ncbi:hypothetical protein BGX38DRAFT_1235878, partial [Terfezia claveryi]
MLAAIAGVGMLSPLSTEIACSHGGMAVPISLVWQFSRSSLDCLDKPISTVLVHSKRKPYGNWSFYVGREIGRPCWTPGSVEPEI